MRDNRTLIKTSFPDYLSFEKLRAAGLAHLEDLGTELWTDFNIHDPGMTIVDVLCYALTDLGYRANLPIEDLLAKDPAANGEEDNFFTAAEILTCNPVTVDDLRRLLIDTPGVNNAWLERTDRGEVPFYVNPERCELQYEIPAVYATAEEAEDNARLPLGGLYTVSLDVAAEEVVDACGEVSRSTAPVLERVRGVVHEHRSLCEDFVDLVVLGDEEIAVCADIELSAEADPESVLLQIYQDLQAFLAPTLEFYSLKEMLAKGKRIEEIYAGRPLRSVSHGFIDTAELEAADLREYLYVSDLYQVIMDVPGVEAIEKLVVTNYVNDIAQTQGEEWCVNLTPKYRPTLDVARSRINFLKNSLPFGVDRTQVRTDYEELQEASTKAFRSAYDLDRSIPAGTHRDIEDYRSIQHEFPLVYGIGSYGPDLSGLDREERHERIAQARQLKGYLFFFDQILANYLSQLTHIRDLFSMQSDDDPARADRAHTYFTQLLSDVPDIEDLIRTVDPESTASGDGSENEGTPDLEAFAMYVAEIAETPDVYYERRGRFLDHLMARFAESFADYVLLMYRLNGKRHDNEELLADKTAFLQSYPTISRNRGKGFDYTDGDEIWDTANVSGLEKRVSRLMGIEDITRRYLAHCEVVHVDGRYRFRIVQEDRVLAVSSADYPDRTTAVAAVDRFLQRGGDESNYRRLIYEGSDRHGFVLMNASEEPLVEAPRLWRSPVTRDARLLALIGYARQPAVYCRVIQADECYFYVLYESAFDAGEDDPQAHTLLIAERGRAAAAGAEQAFEDRFIPAARNISNYERTYGPCGFSFVLRDPDTGDVTARHPRSYDTERERDDRLQALVLYLSHPAVEYRTPGTEGSFQYEIRDDEDVVQFEGRETYPTEGMGSGACRAALRLARYRTHYRTLDDLDADAPYGFELIDRDGAVVADHPHSYAAASERDDAIDALIDKAERADEGLLTCSVEGTPGSFTFELYLTLAGGGERLLFTSIDTFTERTLARQAYQAFLDLARERQHYFPESSFSFALREDSEAEGWGSMVASHPQTYVSEAQRDAAIELIRTYVRDDPVVNEVINTEASYYFALTDSSGKPLLESANAYPLVEEAEEAFQEFLTAATDPDRYVKTAAGPEPCPHGFELRAAPDEDEPAPAGEPPGRLIAVHPRTYRMAEERDRRIDEVVARAGDDPEPQIRGTDCGYYYEQVCAGHRFRSVERFPDEGRAMRACVDSGSILTVEERYDRPAAGPYADHLIVKDADGTVILSYRGPAESPDSLDEIPGEVVDAASAGAVEVWYERDPSGYVVELADRDTGESFFRSRDIRTPVAAYSPEGSLDDPDSRDETIDYLVQVLNESPPAPEILQRGDRYFFALLRDEEPVLISRVGYETEQEARRAFDAFVDTGDDPENYRRFDLEADGGYGFEVYDPAAARRLREDACTDCSRIVERAQDSGHFRWITDRNECLHGFELTGEDGQSLALHRPFYRSEAAREEQIQAIIDLVNDEGFHLVENLLLRPRNPGSPLADPGESDAADRFFPLTDGCLDDEGNICFLMSDPYSFRATVVLPYWPERFQDMSFRSFFERTIRAEAPAHVYLRICWVTPCQMRAFENAYRRWLQTMALPDNACASTDALNRLLEVLCALRNVYPEATLGACDADASGTRVILNQTLLGSV